MRLSTTLNAQGIVSFMLTPTSQPVDQKLIHYLLTHERVRANNRQPIDKMDI
jgi:hypothetical protein